MDLIIKINGAVSSSNFEEFESSVMEKVQSINTDLQTDDDFAEAEGAIKVFKSTEINIAQAKQDGINQTKDISDLFTMMDKLSDKIRTTRLKLEKDVKQEKERRKNEVFENGVSIVISAASDSTVPPHAFTVDREAIKKAIHGKKSIEKMRAAVQEEVDRQIQNLKNLQEIVNTNTAEIEKAETEFPGLFPDKTNLVAQQPEIITATIKSRIDSFKLAEIEKQKKAEEAEKTKDHSREEPPALKEDNRQTHAAHPEEYLLTVDIKGNKDEAIKLAREVDDLFRGVGIVKSVNLSRK